MVEGVVEQVEQFQGSAVGAVLLRLHGLLRSLVERREHGLVVDGGFQETRLRRNIVQAVAELLSGQVEGHEAALVLAQFAQPLAIADVEVARQRVEERRREESVRDFGLVLGVASADVLTQLVGDVHIGQVELCQLAVHESARLHAEVLQRERLLVVGQSELLVDGVLGISVDGLQLVVGNGKEVEYREGAYILHQMGVVALAVAARIVEIGVRRHLVAQVVAGIDFRQRQVHAVLAQARQVVVIVEQGRLGLRDEVAARDGAVVVLLHIEIGQHRQCADAGVAQVATVIDLRVAGSIADVLHDDGIAGSTRAAEDARHDEHAVALLEHVGELLELLGVLELVQGNASDVGRTHETNVHLRIQLVVAEHHRAQRLVARIEGGIVDEVLELLRLDGTHIEEERVAELRAVGQDVGQARYLH